MRPAGREGLEDEVEDVDEDEDEEEVVALGDAGCAVIRAVAGLWVAAASAAATAGRTEGMSSGRRLGTCGLGGPGRNLGAQRADLAGSSGRGRRRAAVFAFWARRGQGFAMGEVVRVGVRGRKQFAWAAFGGRGGWAWGSGAVCGGRMRVTGREWVCCGALGLLRWVYAGCRVSGVARGVRQEGPWRARVWAGGGGPCCGARGCARWRACVGRRAGCGGGRAGAGIAGGGCVVSVYVSASSGAPVRSVVGRSVWRRSLPSSAAAARISQMSVRSWCTSWSVVGRGYASLGLRPTQQRIMWMAWYPQVRECCGLGGGVLPRVRACLDLCVGGGDGPDPGHGPFGWPAALDPLGQAKHGQSWVVARPP